MTLNNICIIKYLCSFVRNQEFSLFSKALISVLLRTSNVCTFPAAVCVFLYLSHVRSYYVVTYIRRIPTPCHMG